MVVVVNGRHSVVYCRQADLLSIWTRRTLACVLMLQCSKSIDVRACGRHHLLRAASLMFGGKIVSTIIEDLGRLQRDT